MTNSYKAHDRYEKKLMSAIERNEFIEIPDQKKEVRRVIHYFKSMPKKEKRVTIRIHKQDLDEIQNKAIESGIPYQTLISAVLHRFAKGKIAISF